MSNQLPPDQLKVSLDTTRPIQIETSVEILSTLTQSLRANALIDDQARIEIVEVVQGSWWVQLLIIAGGFGAIAAGAQGLAEEIRAGRTPFSRAIAAATAEGNADRCTISTSEDSLEIPKQAMRALAGMIPGNNIYGVGPYGRDSSRSEFPDNDSASPVIEDDVLKDAQQAATYSATYIGDIETEIEKLVRKLKDGKFYPALPENARPIDASDLGTSGTKRRRRGSFHFADSGKLIFYTDGTYGEARLRAGLPSPSVVGARDVGARIMSDPRSEAIYFAIDDYGQDPLF